MGWLPRKNEWKETEIESNFSRFHNFFSGSMASQQRSGRVVLWALAAAGSVAAGLQSFAPLAQLADWFAIMNALGAWLVISGTASASCAICLCLIFFLFLLLLLLFLCLRLLRLCLLLGLLVIPSSRTSPFPFPFPSFSLFRFLFFPSSGCALRLMPAQARICAPPSSLNGVWRGASAPC